jgi:hypothetical protein
VREEDGIELTWIDLALNIHRSTHSRNAAIESETNREYRCIHPVTERRDGPPALRVNELETRADSKKNPK